jgi:RNA polymerase sigma-70 factor (ECF subfamily)
MSWIRALADHLPPPDPRPISEVDDDIREELQFHLEMRTQDNLAAGMTPEGARHDALRRFGDFERVRMACRRIHVGERIMLQRIQTLLTLVLLGAVIFLGVAHYNGQRAQEAAVARMTEALEKIAAGSREGSSLPQTELAAKLAAAPPVVMETSPKTGATDVDPALAEIRVAFSKEMMDGSWSWSQTSDETFPETTGEPRYLADGKTCVLPVKLQPGRTYEIWLNSQKFRNFKDREGRPAVPHFLQFQTQK